MPLFYAYLLCHNLGMSDPQNPQPPFRPQQGAPPQPQGYPQPGGPGPQQGGFGQAPGGVPPQGYPPQQGGAGQQMGGYPPQQGGYGQAPGGMPPQGYPPQQGGYGPPQGYPPRPAAKKGLPIWVWLIVGFFALMLLVGAAVSYFAYRMVKNVETAGKNPVSAIVRMAAAANPDIDVLNYDENTGKITVRDKKTGKTVTIDSDMVKDGKITIETDEGKAEIGAGASVKTPNWVFLPPGIKVVGGLSGSGPKGDSGSVVFTGGGSITDLKSFFEDKYGGAGFNKSQSSLTNSNGDESIHLVFEHEGRKRTVTVIAAKSTEGVGGTVTFAENE